MRSFREFIEQLSEAKKLGDDPEKEHVGKEAEDRPARIEKKIGKKERVARTDKEQNLISTEGPTRRKKEPPAYFIFELKVLSDLLGKVSTIRGRTYDYFHPYRNPDEVDPKEKHIPTNHKGRESGPDLLLPDVPLDKNGYPDVNRINNLPNEYPDYKLNTKNGLFGYLRQEIWIDAKTTKTATIKYGQVQVRELTASHDSWIDKYLRWFTRHDVPAGKKEERHITTDWQEHTNEILNYFNSNKREIFNKLKLIGKGENGKEYVSMLALEGSGRDILYYTIDDNKHIFDQGEFVFVGKGFTLRYQIPVAGKKVRLFSLTRVSRTAGVKATMAKKMIQQEFDLKEADDQPPKPPTPAAGAAGARPSDFYWHLVFKADEEISTATFANLLYSAHGGYPRPYRKKKFADAGSNIKDELPIKITGGGGEAKTGSEREQGPLGGKSEEEQRKRFLQQNVSTKYRKHQIAGKKTGQVKSKKTDENTITKEDLREWMINRAKYDV